MSAKKDQGHISSYTRKLRENVKAILENYGEMLKAAKVGLTERSKASPDPQLRPFSSVGIRRGAAESCGGASGSCRARNRSPSSEHCKRGSPSPNSRSYKALNPSGSRGRKSIEAGVGSEGVPNPQRLLERQRLVHAAHLGAGRGPGEEQGGAGSSVQSGGRSGGGSRRTDCESCSPATEPGTAAVAARANAQNYVALLLLFSLAFLCKRGARMAAR